MKHKVGDKVKIKSLKWYDANNDYGTVCNCGEDTFVEDMSEYCGMYAIIEGINKHGYSIDLDGADWNWTDEMFEEIN